MKMMLRLLLIALGGSVGSVSRYLLAGAVQQLIELEFPIGTLAVNTFGSFLIGVFMALSLERGMIGPEIRTLLTVGFCGGFTTMSTLSYETLMLARSDSFGIALLNVAASVSLCLAAVWLGSVVARLL